MSLTAFITVICNKYVGLKYKDVKFPLSKGIGLKTFNFLYPYMHNSFPLDKINWKSVGKAIWSYLPLNTLRHCVFFKVCLNNNHY